MTSSGSFPGRTIRYLVATLHALVGFYYLVASPPLQLYFEPLQPAGVNSVYVPGSGFSGFWYHLGLFSNLQHHQTDSRNASSHDEDGSFEYYCYSSGCLSLVLAASRCSPNDIYQAAQLVQKNWLKGNSHRYDIVDSFLHKVLPDDSNESDIQSLLPHLHVLVTTVNNGVVVQTPQTVHHLRSLLLQTTYIPFVTGAAPALTVPAHYHNGNIVTTVTHPKTTRVLDGGFSRTLHPVCEQTWSVPLTWKLAWHTLNPGLEQDDARSFWEKGRRDALQREGISLEQENDSSFSRWYYPEACAAASTSRTSDVLPPSPFRSDRPHYRHLTINRTSDQPTSTTQVESETQRVKMAPGAHSILREQRT